MMKKMLVAALLLPALYVTGQNQEKSTTASTRFGIKAGANMSNTNDGFGSGTLFKDPGFKAGFTGGLFANIPLSRHISLQPELLYSTEGSLQEGVIGASSSFVTVFDLSLHYLQIPVMAQYHTGGGFYVEAGPQFGFLLNSEVENKFPGTGNPGTTDLKDDTKGTAFGLGAGLGYNTKGGFGFGARYTSRLTDIWEGASNLELKGSIIYVGVHYRFSGKK